MVLCSTLGIKCGALQYSGDTTWYCGVQRGRKWYCPVLRRQCVVLSSTPGIECGTVQYSWDKMCYCAVTVILSLPLFQEGQLLVSGVRMCTILVNSLED